MTDHPDYVAQLAKCCTDPDSDTPRLILADWLDEYGEPERAELIRFGCELARDLGRMGDLRYTAVRRRGIGIIEAHGRGWVAPMVHAMKGRDGQFMEWDGFGVRYHSTRVVRWSWRRGFPDHFELSAADWVAHGDALSWHPSEARFCPPTACPGGSVRLTTEPIVESSSSRHTLHGDPRRVRIDVYEVEREAAAMNLPHADRHRNTIVAMLRLRWPGVRAWHLPEPGRRRVQFVGGPLRGEYQAVATDAGGNLPLRYRIPEAVPGRVSSARDFAADGIPTFRFVEYRLEWWLTADRRRVPYYVLASMSQAEATRELEGVA